MKKTSKIILISVLTIVACISLISGATFALFTSESSVNIAVTSGKVNVEATVGELHTYSYTEHDGSISETEMDYGKFYAGTAAISADGHQLTLDQMIPGDRATFDISIENTSNVVVQYRAVITCAEDNGLFAGLTVKINDDSFTGGLTAYTHWQQLQPGVNPDAVHVQIALPYEGENQNVYQGKTCTITYKVEAVQGNAEVKDVQEGHLGVFVPSDLLAISNLVKGGETDVDIDIMDNLDFTGQAWSTIGKSNAQYTGKFNGNGFTAKGLSDSLFDYVGPGAEFSDFTLEVNLPRIYAGFACYLRTSISKPTKFTNITVRGQMGAENSSVAKAAFTYTATGEDNAAISETPDLIYENCVNEANVTANGGNRACGFIATNYGATILFKGCKNTGNMKLTTTAEAHGGAFIGYSMRNTAAAATNSNNFTVKFQDCINAGTIETTSTSDGRSNVGGYISTAQNGSLYSFENCVNEGAVIGTDTTLKAQACIGGFIGRNNVGTAAAVFINCTNKGAISANTTNAATDGNTSNAYAGGFVGLGAGTLTNGVSVGTVIATAAGERSTHQLQGLLCGSGSPVISGVITLLQSDIDSETPLCGSGTPTGEYETKAYQAE